MSEPPDSLPTLGQYVLLERLGEGGMGEVYKARHSRLDRLVAVKIIRTDHLKTKTAVRRFVRELRTVARLDHPLIVRAFDAGSDSGKHFLAMEYVEGEDFGRYVDRNGPLGAAEACRVVFQVALALQHLHECGITHRDLKPSNLLRVHATGQVKLLDLGLARVSPESRDDDDSGTMTQVGTILGTPDYMAPEQALDSTRTDIRSDLYSLGCVFFFLLTGRPPFAGGTTVAKMIRHHDEVPPLVSELRPGIPPEVASIVARLLAKRPADRFPTPAALNQALLALGSVPNVPAVAAEQVVPQATEVMEGRPEEPRFGLSSLLNEDLAQLSEPGRLAPPLPDEHRGRGLLVGTGLLVLLAVCLVFFAFGKRGKIKPVDDAGVAAASRAAEDAAVRSEAFADYMRGFGTQQAQEAAERLRKLPSPLDTIRRPLNEGPAMILGQPGAFHVGAVYYLAVTPDGRTVVFGGWDRTVRVWDGANLKQRHVLTGHRDPVHYVAVSPDGKRVLGTSSFESWYTGNIGFERAVRVWDTASGELLLEHDSDNGGWSISGAFTREGAVLIGKYESLELWDIEKDKRIWKGHDPGMDWQGVTILSADGSHVFTGGNYKNQVRVWERETGKLLHKLDGHYGNVSRLAACPDNTRIASIGRDDNVRIWDYKTGKPLTVIPFTDSRPQATAWTPDGASLIVAATDGSVRRYDPENGKELRRSVGHLGPVTAVAVGGGSVFTAGLDGTIRKWDSNIEKEILPARPAYPAVKLVFTDEDRELLAVPQFGKPATYHLLDSPPSEVPWTGPDIYPISLSATGGTILGRTRDWQLVVGDLTTGNVVPVEQLQAKDTTRFTLSPDGKRCLAVGSQSVEWVEFPTGAVIHQLADWSVEPVASAVSNDGGLGAVVSKDGNVTIWDLKSGKTVRAASLSKEDGTMLLFGADGRKLYVFGRSETVWEMDVAGDTEPTSLEPHEVTPRCAATAPDNKRIATATNNGEIVIRTLGMTRPRILKAPHPVTALAFSVDGRLLAAALGNGTIALYRVGP